jgi:class 3 adenylate cyclase
VAARIESENKRLGTEVLVSDETYRSLPPAERQRLRDAEQPVAVAVKGKHDLVYVHPIVVA